MWEAPRPRRARRRAWRGGAAACGGGMAGGGGPAPHLGGADANRTGVRPQGATGRLPSPVEEETMTHRKAAAVAWTPSGTEHFTGEVRSGPPHAPHDPAGLNAP